MTKLLTVKEFMNPVHSCDSCNNELNIPKDGDNYFDKFLCEDCKKHWGE